MGFGKIGVFDRRFKQMPLYLLKLLYKIVKN